MKDLLRFLILAVVGQCLIQTRDCLGEFVEDGYFRCKVIGNIDWNGFINDFMKNTDIINITPKR